MRRTLWKVCLAQARSELDATEWATRLSALSTYWRARERADALEGMACTPGNAFRSRSAYRDAATGLADPVDPVVDRVDPVLFSRAFDFCHLRGCHGVLRVGRLYASTSHASGGARAKERQYVLVRGALLAFKVARTTTWTGTSVPSVFHARSGKRIDLRGAYLLTGAVCRLDATTPSATPFGGEREGRVYPDGLIAYDDEAQCAFELWRPTAKAVGSKGKVITFRARSRVRARRLPETRT
jgi:hypothetical protein